jgi:DUF1016 N-terminal domain
MEQILFDIRRIIEEARGRVARSINHERTVAYWLIGERIVIEEQNGQQRADYGKYLIKGLSKSLTVEYEDGFSTTNLWLMRQLYLTFPILHSLSGELSWTHYKVLVRIDNSDKRAFLSRKASKMRGLFVKWSDKSTVYCMIVY